MAGAHDGTEPCVEPCGPAMKSDETSLSTYGTRLRDCAKSAACLSPSGVIVVGLRRGRLRNLAAAGFTGKDFPAGTVGPCRRPGAQGDP
jgi:hypothetical protein